MGEPVTNDNGGAGSSQEASTSRRIMEGRATYTESAVCCCTEDLDPAVVASMTADELKKFIETGRTGRRNALPDVTEHGVITTSTAGVSEALQTLSVGGADKNPKEGDEGS